MKAENLIKFYPLLHPSVCFYLRHFCKKNNITANISEEIKSLKPPYFILPNHYGWWDPFVIAAFIKDPIYYVSSAIYFREPLKRIELYLLGGIPKKRGEVDSTSTKKIFKAIRDKKVVGIFPEGVRSWDGKSLPIIESTAKLIKKMKVPVVIPVHSGMFFSNPRWSEQFFDYPVKIDFKLLSVDEINKLDEKLLLQKLKKMLYHDDILYQKENLYQMHSKNRAKYITRVLFYCPHCERIGSLFLSGKDKTNISCKNCDFHIHVNAYGFFESLNPDIPVYFDNIADWFAKIKEILPIYIETYKKSKDKVPIFQAKCSLFHSLDERPFGKKGKGTLSLYEDKVIFYPYIQNRPPFIFPLNSLSGCISQEKEYLGFFIKKDAYRFEWLDKEESGLKWQMSINYLIHKPMLTPAEI